MTSLGFYTDTEKSTELLKKYTYTRRGEMKKLILLLFLGVSLLTFASNDMDTLKKENETLKTEKEELNMQVNVLTNMLLKQRERIEELEKGKSTTVENLDNEGSIFKEISVEVTDKINHKGDFSNFAEIVVTIKNDSQKEIRGLEGEIEILDMFNKQIMDSKWEYTEKPIKPGTSYVQKGKGMEVNEFISEQVKIYKTEYKDLIFKININHVLFTDGTSYKR